MKTLAITTILVTALVSSAAADSVRITSIPDSVRITVTSIDCPFDFTNAISPDFEAVTLNFSDTMLWTDQRSAHCRIGIDYAYPAGWRFRRPGGAARGVALLNDDGQTSVWALRTRLGNGAWRSENAVTEGPVESNIQVEVPGGVSEGSPATACGATSAHLEVELFGALFLATPPSETPISTIDSIDTAIHWERCP